MTKSLEILIKREGNHFNSCNNHTLVYCALLGNHIPGSLGLPPTSFYLAMVFKVMAWAICGSYSVFLDIS